MTKGLCIVCHERPREVPDRETMGRPIKRVCRQCHGQRLKGDLKRIMDPKRADNWIAGEITGNTYE